MTGNVPAAQARRRSRPDQNQIKTRKNNERNGSYY